MLEHGARRHDHARPALLHVSGDERAQGRANLLADIILRALQIGLPALDFLRSLLLAGFKGLNPVFERLARQ